MLFTEWTVLLVDDEPDVLSVTKLAMRAFKIHGLSLNIYTAESKAAAVALLENNPELAWSLAVAFVDVVMENDQAGLELCHFIRETCGNRLVQLYIRTGQPGVAPERRVIDEYDINGYFTKMETTEDKLYSLVKSGIRQFLWARQSMETTHLLNTVIAGLGSRAEMTELLRAASTSRGQLLVDHCTMVNGKFLFSTQPDHSMIIDLLDLNQLEGTTLHDRGDKYVVDENNCQMIKIAASRSTAETIAYFKTPFSPPAYVIDMFYSVLKAVAFVWKRSHE
jgi:CheY-like chemotaxis protein